jgi:hypothetical protein
MRVDRWCYVVGGVLVASGLLHLGVAAVYPRPWTGPLSWRKPVTFGLSFGLVLITVVWVSSYLRISARLRAVLLVTFAVDCVVEVAGITVQAWRDVPSHLNTTTPANASVAFSLAVGGGVLLVVLGTFAVAALRGRVTGPPSMQLAIRAGFALLVAGLVAGMAMIARGEVLLRSGDAQAAYDHAGFLKLFHGVALHALLVLPFTAWLLGRTELTEARRTTVVRAVTGVYAAVAACALIVGVALV